MFDFLRNLTKSAEEKRQEAVSAYLDGAFAPAERRRFEQQLARDPGLQVELEQQRRLQQTLRQLPPRPVPRSFTLDPALYGRPQPQPLVQLYPVLRLATALTAVFLVAVVILDLLTPAGAPSFSGLAEPAADTVSMAVEVTRVVTEEIAVEGELVAVTRVIEEVVIVEEEAVAEAETAEEAAAEAAAEPVEEEPASEDELLTLEAAEDATATVLERTLEAPARPATEIEPFATAPLPAATAAPDLAETANATVEQADEEPASAADEAPAEVFRDTDVGPTRPAPLGNFRQLQVGLGVAFVLLALVTYLARRQL